MRPCRTAAQSPSGSASSTTPTYDDKSQLTTVDLQLREGRGVVASVETVLNPDQKSEARALALEVKAAIEAGEIGLHAHELEPFADKLR